jgi:cysteine-rich repeat protein
MVKQSMDEEGTAIVDYCKCVSSQQVYQVAEWRVGRQVHQEYLYCKSYNENKICQCYPECDPVAMVGNKCAKSINPMVISNMLD